MEIARAIKRGPAVFARAHRRRLSASAPVSLSRPAGVSGRPGPLPGARRAAAGRRAVCGGAGSGSSRSPSRKAPARRWWSSWRRRTGGSRLTAVWSGDPEVAAADGLLRDVKYLGGWERLSSLAAEIDQHGARRKASIGPARGRRGRGRAARDDRRALGIAAGVGVAVVRGGTRAPASTRRRVARPPPPRARGDSGGARVAPRCASPARRRAGRDRRALRHRSPVDRGTDVLSAHRHARTDAPRCTGRRVRGRRPVAARRPG